jgi:hypothetical protein
LRGEPDAVWEVVRKLDVATVPPEVTAELSVPTPIPAAWAVYALSDFDRSARWALRSAETGIPVPELQAGSYRPAATYRGIDLVQVSDGSWLSRLDPSNPLQKAFERKTWIVVGGWMTAFVLAGWTVDQVKSWFEPDVPRMIEIRERPAIVGPGRVEGPTLPTPPTVVHVTGEIRGTVTVQVGSTTVVFSVSPGEGWMPDEARRPRP